MALDIRESLEENQRSISLGSILVVTLIGAIILFTYVDITVHDFYILPLTKLCYTGNHNPDCVEIQTIHNCPNGGDACIEAMYAQMIQVQAFALAGFLVFLKLAISQGVLKFEFNWVRGYQTFVWGALPLVLLFTGWEDALYYAVRQMAIPSTLPWLNNAGLMPYVMQYITHDTVAGSMDLFIVMAGGLLAVLLMWYFYAKVTRDEDYAIPM